MRQQLALSHAYPSTLGRYADALERGFSEWSAESKCALSVAHPERCAQADGILVQVHGCGSEARISGEDWRGMKKPVVVMIHRPEELLLRLGEAETRRYLEQSLEASAIVLLSTPSLPLYRALFPALPVHVVYHGFFAAGTPRRGLESERDAVESAGEGVHPIVIGSYTTWGEMRHLDDLHRLWRAVRGASDVPLVAVAGGKFDAKQHARARELCTQCNDVLLLSDLDLGCCSCPADVRAWLFEVSRNGTNMLVDDVGLLSEEKLPRAAGSLEAALPLDFQVQVYREILRSDAPDKVESSGTLHLSGGPSIPVVADTAAMRDIASGEGLRCVFIPLVREGDAMSLDFRTAAEEISRLAVNEEEMSAIVQHNVEIAAANNMANTAGQYVSILNELLPE